ncbi:hypothetical protein RCL1_001132 [Eukaryota sp. TZLM3-RCL]
MTPSNPLKIVTHSGRFHADDALSVFLLQQLPQFRDAEIIRSRDPDVIASADVVVDIGGVYDPTLNRFDHHQRDFAESFPDSEVKLASCGLVWDTSYCFYVW